MNPLPWGFLVGEGGEEGRKKRNRWSKEWDLWSEQSVPLSLSEPGPQNREDRGQGSECRSSAHTPAAPAAAVIFLYLCLLKSNGKWESIQIWICCTVASWLQVEAEVSYCRFFLCRGPQLWKLAFSALWHLMSFCVTGMLTHTKYSSRADYQGDHLLWPVGVEKKHKK